MKRLIKQILIATVALIGVTSIAVAEQHNMPHQQDMQQGTQQKGMQHDMQPGGMQDYKTIVMGAAANRNLSTLVKAIVAAKLIRTLEQRGPYTVFAPTNIAFNKLPKGKLKMLMDPKNRAKLKSILLYHVIPGKKLTLDDLKSGKLKTANGQTIKVKVKGNKVYLNGKVMVTRTDIMTNNGVIHLVSGVLMPSKK